MFSFMLTDSDKPIRLCKRIRLNYRKLSEEEKKWLKKISEKSDLLKNPNLQRGLR